MGLVQVSSWLPSHVGLFLREQSSWTDCERPSARRRAGVTSVLIKTSSGERTADKQARACKCLVPVERLLAAGL